ncbi:hypothetical protein F3I16_00735 [Pseudomonas sp. L-22-4S-12]|uniref:hypothetical protein n=1 Tax=Pseudomonas sp. L-22-4S-12 TaxID=2610893 RepID=UPI001327667B|nr:hypothetical protein [Pseudomonas sp. L-22-4S-12]MWV14554.1 hypothetical protein [Pseudomonas sp. L-22-4S-12]
MHLSPRRTLLLAALLALSNAPALAGKGAVVGGGVARTIECNQSLARQLQLDERLKRLPGNPPDRGRQHFAALFDLRSLNCPRG